MRRCENCKWVFTNKDEEIAREENTCDYDLDDNASHAGDCCLSSTCNSDGYCFSHDFNEDADDYKIYREINGRKTFSIDLYLLLSSVWSKDEISSVKSIITSLLINDLYGGKIMVCTPINGDSYYNIVNDSIINLTRDRFDNDYVFPYEKSREVKREDILNSDEIREKYSKFLSLIRSELLRKFSVEIEGSDKCFNGMLPYSNFNIINYYKDKDIEYVDIGMGDTNSVNVRYMHNLATDEYMQVACQSALTLDGDYSYVSIPEDVLKSIFESAKMNEDAIKFVHRMNKFNLY